MEGFSKVATKEEIAPGEGKLIELGEKTIGLFNIEGTFYAIDNTCPHRGGPLSEGFCEETIVTCPWHGWQFNVATGENAIDANIKIGTYPVKTEGDDVLIAA